MHSHAMTLAWLGLSACPNGSAHSLLLAFSFFQHNSVQYANIYQDNYLNVGIFFLPKGSMIPLHDHPFMTVFS